MTDINLTHPGSKQPITVREDQAESYRSQGWVDAPAKPEHPNPEK